MEALTKIRTDLETLAACWDDTLGVEDMADLEDIVSELRRLDDVLWGIEPVRGGAA